MAGNSKRDIVTLESTAGTGYRYSVTKNKRLHRACRVDGF